MLGTARQPTNQQLPQSTCSGSTPNQNNNNSNTQPLPGKMASVYPELYTKNSRVWIKHKDEVWQCGVVSQTFDKTSTKLYVIAEDSQEEICLEVKENSHLPPLRNPDILIGANDLTSLSYLHEPSVLYNLRVRFLQQNSIYTWCGIVLVAINPFCDLPIYGDETIQTYHSNYALSQLDPHIYAVAEDAFTKLERNETNQSVIVSGESGAGKTVSAKFAMRYFASIAGSDSNIEARVLASNPIMEAIGNAKTVRNDNSSRFGKYIQILFDRRSRAIMGGNMRTYLLEKSRVTYQGPGERNFHIFYQLCDWAKDKGLTHLGLQHFDFSYLGSGEKSQYDDMSKFIEALDTLGFKEEQKSVIFSVVGAILHGGNVDFRAIDEERCEISPQSEENFKLFCALLKLNESATRQWLTHRLLTSGRELITTPLSFTVAQYGKEALLKFIYDKLFSWIVRLINHALGPCAPLSDFHFIGVLDIYGFEHFEINSFEQFCINYANEVLQQQFTLHVFKLEQEEYIRENIDWQFISFNDNQQVIDLIETKPIGMLSLLDEECRMPRGSDENWCTKLYQQLPVGDVFKKPKIGYQKSFIIQHFADTVIYTVTGFLEKNRDTILEEHIDLLKRSDVTETLFVEEPTPGGEERKGAGGKIKVAHVSEAQRNAQAKKKAKATVGSQFRESLDALMKILNSTEPHYVRCIKPNDSKGAFEFDNLRAVQQLRACGVLETIRISSNGFPSRWSYPDFANRYRVLRVGHHDRLVKQDSQDSTTTTTTMGAVPRVTPRKLVRAGSNQTQEIKQICEDIVKIVYEEKVYAHFNLQKDEGGANGGNAQAEIEKTRQLYQFGKTKIFFRAGQVALLERIRSQKLRECAILMQRMVRGWLVRRRYVKLRESILVIQRLSRGHLARKHYRFLRETKAATKIQTSWRSFYQRQKYLRIQKSILSLQTHIRGFLARKRYQAVRQKLAAIAIQRYWRGYHARKLYKKQLRRVVIVQCCVRRHLAKKQLKKLRIEARSVEHVTNLNKGLEMKIIELQQRINELQNEHRGLKSKQGLYDSLKIEYQQLNDKLAGVTAKEKEELEIQSKLRSELENMQTTNQELMNKMEKLNVKNSTLEEKLVSSAEDMRKSQIDSQKIDEAVKQREEELRAQFEKEKRVLIADKEKEQIAKQQLLSRYMDLESSQMESSQLVERGPVVVVPQLPLPKMSDISGVIESEVRQSTPEKESTEVNIRDFDTNLQQISLSMRCTELEHENDKFKEDIKKLRKQLAKFIDHSQSENTEVEKSNAGAALLQEQFQDLQEELERYKKERADLKRVILIEDWITTSNPGNAEEKYQNNLVAAYKSLYTQLDEQIRKKDVVIQKQKNEIIYLRCNSGTLKGPMSLTSGNSSYLSFDPHSLENMDIEPSVYFRGMFKFKQCDIDFIVRFLVYDVGPQNSFKCDAQTVSYIIYMCIRYIDHVNNEEMVQRFMTELIGNIKKKAQSAITKNGIESIVHVLSMTFKLATLLKYYSEYDIGQQNKKAEDSGFNADSNDVNSDEEDFDFSQSLKNFDLTDYTKIFRDLIIWVYMKLVKMFQARINNYIVPALLEHEELASSGMYVQKSINRSGSISDRDTPSPTEKEIHTLIKEMSNIETMFRMHKLDDEFIYQFFKQIYYFIGTVSMNNLLMRKDLCNNNKAMQIIYNISNMEQFIREHNIPNREQVKAQMDGISQASKLLITNKTDKQITAIIQTTEALSIQQILKLLNMYTASDEEQISPQFIKQLTLALQKDRQGRKDDLTAKQIVMQTQVVFPLMIPYIDDQEASQTTTTPSGQTCSNSSAVVAGLKVNFKEVELPILLKGLERHLEKI